MCHPKTRNGDGTARMAREKRLINSSQKIAAVWERRPSAVRWCLFAGVLGVALVRRSFCFLNGTRLCAAGPNRAQAACRSPFGHWKAMVAFLYLAGQKLPGPITPKEYCHGKRWTQTSEAEAQRSQEASRQADRRQVGPDSYVGTSRRRVEPGSSGNARRLTSSCNAKSLNRPIPSVRHADPN